MLGELVLGDVGDGALSPGQGVEPGGVQVGEQGRGPPPRSNPTLARIRRTSGPDAGTDQDSVGLFLYRCWYYGLHPKRWPGLARLGVRAVTQARVRQPVGRFLWSQAQWLRGRETEKRTATSAPEPTRPALTIPPDDPSTPIVFEPVDRPVVSIVVPAHDNWRYTHLCLRAVSEHTDAPTYEVVLADDDSHDETATGGNVLEGVVHLAEASGTPTRLPRELQQRGAICPRAVHRLPEQRYRRAAGLARSDARARARRFGRRGRPEARVRGRAPPGSGRHHLARRKRGELRAGTVTPTRRTSTT